MKEWFVAIMIGLTLGAHLAPLAVLSIRNPQDRTPTSLNPVTLSLHLGDIEKKGRILE
jgi:hypothetical protein